MPAERLGCGHRAEARQAALPFLVPIMYSPSTSSLASDGRHHHGEFAAVHHRDAIRQREDFVELGADEQDRLALRARVEQLLVNELDRADIDAARWLRREEHGEVLCPISRAIDDLLLIAARERARGKTADWAAGCRRRRSPRIAFSITRSRSMIAAFREMLLDAENQVVGDRVLEDQSAAVPVFGNVREAGIVALLQRVRRVTSTPSIRMSPLETGSESSERFDELRLAVSLDAGDAEYLARLDAEAHTVDDANAARSDDAEISDLETLIGLRSFRCARSAARACPRRARLRARPSARAISAGVVSEVLIRATVCPARMTVMVSESSTTSSRRWVMSTIVSPLSRSRRSTAHSSRTSGGERTAVGSSRTRIFAPRKRTLRISTRCASPTERSETSLSGAMTSPVSLDSFRTSSAARL